MVCFVCGLVLALIIVAFSWVGLGNYIQKLERDVKYWRERCEKWKNIALGIYGKEKIKEVEEDDRMHGGEAM